MSSPKKHYSAHNVRRSLWQYLTGRGVTAIASIAFNIILVRALSIPDYASYTALSGLIILITIISSGGLERVIPKFLPELKVAGAAHQLVRLCWRLLELRTGLIIVILIPVVFLREELSALFAIIGGETVMHATIIYILIFTVSWHISRTQEALLLQRDATTGLAIEWFAKLATVLLVLYYGQALTVGVAMWIHVGTATLGALYKFIKLRQYLSSSLTSEPLIQVDFAMERLWRFGWHNYLQSLIVVPQSPSTMRLVSAHFLMSSSTAALGFAYNLVSVLQRYLLPGTLMLGLIEPIFMARYSAHKDFQALNEMGSIVVKINLCLLAPAIVWLMLSGSATIDLITAGKYTDSVWLICALLIATTMDSHIQILEIVANAVEESWLLLTSNLWAAVIGIFQIGAIILYGLHGLIIMTLLISIFRNYYLIWALRTKNHGYKLEWTGSFRILVAAIISGILGSLIMQGIGGFAGSLIAAIITGILFLTMIYFWLPFTQSEQNLMNRFAGRKIFR